jgi:quercetin dioxygenase-like cupin family protein
MNPPTRLVSVLSVLMLVPLVPVCAWRTDAVPLPVASQAAGGSPSSAVTYFSSEQVRAAFAKGETLLGPEGKRNYSVLAMRRDRPGEAEIHALDTDIFYVVEGSATFITGGTAIGSKATAPNEMRGTGIEGGETRHLSKGDVLIIPKGMPHWFKAVEPPFLYYVVKVR